MWVYYATPEQDAMSKWPEIVGLAISFTVLMAMTVALRLWVRRRALYVEDWVIVLTGVFSIIFNAFTIMQTRYGLGLPLVDRPKADYLQYTKFNYAGRPFYTWGIAGFKVALCISYLRLTQGTTDKRYRRFIIAVGTFAFLAETAFGFVNLFACLPLAKNLDQRIPGHCVNLPGLYYSLSAVTILCDVIVFLLPIPLVVKLRLDRSVKIGLVVIFSLGLLTTLCSILRLTATWEIIYGDGNSSLFVMYSTLEFNIGIITSCLPVLRPLLKHLPRRVRDFLSSTKRKQTTGGADAYKMESQASAPKLKTVGTMFSTKTTDKSSGDGESDKDILVARPPQSYANDPDGWKRMSVTKTVQIDVESAYRPGEDDAKRKPASSRWDSHLDD